MTNEMETTNLVRYLDVIVVTDLDSGEVFVVSPAALGDFIALKRFKRFKTTEDCPLILHQNDTKWEPNDENI
jgi:hypothetical protein